MSIVTEFITLMKKNIREYGMYIALAVIMISFSIGTDGMFLSSQNLSNLIDMTGYIAVLAVGMTLVIIIRHIDLSVGYVAGFTGAVAAIFLSQKNFHVVVTICLILLIGALVGLVNGFFVASVGIPAFVVSLAGMFIFKGLLTLALMESGTIIISNEGFNALGNGFIPSLFMINDLNGLTLVVGLIVIVLFFWGDIRTRRNNQKYNFEVISLPMMIIKLMFVSAVIIYIFYKLAGYNGLSWTAVVVILVGIVYHVLTTKTVIGRHIYAVGGNPEAAQLSGISVKKITYFVFGSMGFLAALSGILYAARLSSASPQAGSMFELDAIAAAYVGGVSASGGVGKITGSIIGALVMASLTSGMNLMGIDISYQYVIRGSVLVLAVVFDVMTRKNRA